MLAVVTLPHGQITTLSGEATLSRGLSHHRITLVARLGRALVAEHQAESSLRVQQLHMRLRVAARPQTTKPYPTLPLQLCCSLGLWGFVGVSLTYFPPPLTSLGKSPVFSM